MTVVGSHNRFSNPPTTAVGSHNRLSSPFRTLNPFSKKEGILRWFRDPTAVVTPILTLFMFIFLLHFRLLPLSRCHPCSSLALLLLSSSVLAPFHSQTKIHSSHLVSGVRSCFGTVCIFCFFAFSVCLHFRFTLHFRHCHWFHFVGVVVCVL